MRVRVVVSCAAVVVPLGVAAVALAGGWAVATTTRDVAPAVAGELYTVRVAVRQHGVTLVRLAGMTAEATGPGGVRVQGVVRVLPRVGRYAVDFTFPAAGTWSWVLGKRPFADQQMGTIAVSATGAAVSSPPLDGRSLFRAKGCIVCHVGPEPANESIGIGPSLAAVGDRFGKAALAYVRQSILKPDAVDASPGEDTFSRMPRFEVSDAEARAIAAYLVRAGRS